MYQKPFKQAVLFRSLSVPVYVGWTLQKNPRPYPLAYHPEYEFQFIKNGQGAYYLQGKKWRFKSRQLIIIHPNQIHGFIPRTGAWLEKAQVLFQSRWLNETSRSAGIGRNFPPVLNLTESHAAGIENIVNRLTDEISRREKGWEAMTRELLYEFLLFVRRAKDHPAEAEPENRLFTQLRDYIEIKFADPQCNTTWIAKQFGYSLPYLSSLFKGTSGVGIKQYLVQHRIIAARQLFDKEPMLKVEEVGRRVGFLQYRTFIRDFVAYTGMLPAVYRRKRCAFCRK
ncbi:MAG: helix-turn-helix transcriptional regulator [Verrucomicrobiota bacterium]